ncbi:MAG: transcription regulator containing HTH protein [uncultured bacterium]|nr:MAG: transcription regulator containing HTH protein [uncultured bacterium]
MSKSTLAIDYINQKTEHRFHLPIPVFKKPINDKEYSKLEKILDELIDEIRDNDKHPLALAMQIIGDNLEQYDNEHYPDIGHDVNEIDVIKYLMKSRNLHQIDLANIFGGQANVSKYLNGERPLSKKQITELKNKFGISADFFIK